MPRNRLKGTWLNVTLLIHASPAYFLLTNLFSNAFRRYAHGGSIRIVVNIGEANSRTAVYRTGRTNVRAF